MPNLAILLLALDVTFNDLNFYYISFFNYILLVSTIILVAVNVSIILKKELYHYTISISVFLFFFIGKLVLNSHLENIFHFNIPILIKYLMYLMIGVNYTYLNKKVLRISILVIICGLLNLLNFSTFSIDFDKLYDPFERSVLASSADILVIIYFIYILRNKNGNIKNWFDFSISIIIIIFLFIGGSRTTFVFFLLSFLLVLGLKIRNILIFGLISFLLLNKNFIEYISNIESLEDYRVVKLLSYSEDASFIARNQLFVSGLYDITDNPFFGKFGGQLTSGITDDSTVNRWGGYIHNILSYYRQFGLISFCLIIYLLYYSAKRLIKIDKAFLPIIFFLLTSIFFSRSYTFPYIFIIFGISISFGKNVKYKFK